MTGRFFLQGWWRKAPLAAVFAFVLAAVLTARHGDPRLYPAASDAVTVYLLNYGAHSDIAIPRDLADARSGALAAAAARTGPGDWLLIGWGDAEFYMHAGMNMDRALSGLRALLPIGNASVIRLHAIDRHPAGAYLDTEVFAIALSPEGFEAMLSSIEDSFRDEPAGLAGETSAEAPGTFFASREDFSLFRLCNNWTADQLAAAGLPSTPMTDGFAPLMSLGLRLRAGLNPVREKENRP